MAIHAQPARVSLNTTLNWRWQVKNSRLWLHMYCLTRRWHSLINIIPLTILTSCWLSSLVRLVAVDQYARAQDISAISNKCIDCSPFYLWKHHAATVRSIYILVLISDRILLSAANKKTPANIQKCFSATNIYRFSGIILQGVHRIYRVTLCFWNWVLLWWMGLLMSRDTRLKIVINYQQVVQPVTPPQLSAFVSRLLWQMFRVTSNSASHLLDVYSESMSQRSIMFIQSVIAPLKNKDTFKYLLLSFNYYFLLLEVTSTITSEVSQRLHAFHRDKMINTSVG